MVKLMVVLNEKKEKKVNNNSFSLFFKANFLLTCIIFILFLQYNNNYQIIDFFLAFLGAISSATILYALLYILLFVFKFIGRTGLYLTGLVFILLNTGLLVDYFIYKVFKFHINGMVVNILTSPDAMDSIQAGIMPIVALFVVFIILLTFEVYLINKLQQKDNHSKAVLNRRLNKLVIIPLIFIVLSEKTAYGFSSLFSNKAIISKFKVIPLYQPLTFNRIAAKYFGLKPKVETKNTIQLNADFNYPLKPIELIDKPQKVNIFIFASDSVSASRINSQITPNINTLKQESITLDNHHSGGNTTRFGIFSLLYGLNASYWFTTEEAKKGTVLFDVLKQLNYQINITSSTNTNWPEFKNTCYVNIQDSVKDDFAGRPWEKDKQSTDYFINWVKKQDTKQAMFSFVFLDAPHGYSFPKEVNPFNASDEEINYLTVKANSDEIKMVERQHNNAIYYNDLLFGKMLDQLKQKGLYKDSLIIFTADHGQEFFEFGDFGHNTNFSTAQTQVPMIIKLPDFLKQKISLPKTMIANTLKTLSSHNDIVPTILSLIGVKNAISDYSNGRNLFDDNYQREMVVSSNWNKNAIITNKNIYIFSNTPDKIFSNEIRDSQTYQVLNDATSDSKKVLQVINENRHFLK